MQASETREGQSELEAYSPGGTLSPLLTIAIPTWKRSTYLAETLAQIHAQLILIDKGLVEVLVSDNASPDETQSVVVSVISFGLPVNYIRNTENIGSDANIAQCFNRSKGKYVLILGDDDLLVDGSIALLLTQIRKNNYGVITLRPYGFDHDYRAEHPGGGGHDCVFVNGTEFLAEVGPLMTLISSCVINKSLLPNLDASEFCGGNLVQVHLVILAALAAQENLYLKRYLVACKRNNSGGYDFSAVFVTSFGEILDKFKSRGLTEGDVESIERKFLVGYYPYYLLRQRLNQSGDLAATSQRFNERYRGRVIFEYWVSPIILLPRPLAILWGGFATLLGRVLYGELRRGLSFAMNKLRRISKT